MLYLEHLYKHQARHIPEMSISIAQTITKDTHTHTLLPCIPWSNAAQYNAVLRFTAVLRINAVLRLNAVLRFNAVLCFNAVLRSSSVHLIQLYEGQAEHPASDTKAPLGSTGGKHA